MRNNFPYILKNGLKTTKIYQAARKLIKRLTLEKEVDQRVVTLKPVMAPQGKVLLSYILKAFFLKAEDPRVLRHTHFWETRQIAQTWINLGFEVDVIHWKNKIFKPVRNYDFFIDVRLNMERIGPLLNAGCVKIMHIETAHWLFHTTAQHMRLLDLQKRRQVTLRPSKVVEPNWCIENADCATILGNDFTRRTYAYANKPFYKVPVSTPVMYPFPEDKDYEACRHNFLWFGSGGLVHKGLDMVLEAFAEMTEFRLTVCGPINDEKDFEKAYWKELYGMPQIRTIGWIDVSSPEFLKIADNCIGIVYPSCSEGGGAGVINCLHAGLIPIVSYETSIDICDSMGLTLRECSIIEIQKAVRRVSAMRGEELKTRAKLAWTYARENHTRDKFAADYLKAAEKIKNVYWKSSRGI